MDLSGWTYVLVPGGVRFTHGGVPEEIDRRMCLLQAADAGGGHSNQRGDAAKSTKRIRIQVTC